MKTEITQTERLLQQALAICKGVTNQPDVSHTLLSSVFERLCMELEMQEADGAPLTPAELH